MRAEVRIERNNCSEETIDMTGKDIRCVYFQHMSIGQIIESMMGEVDNPSEIFEHGVVVLQKRAS